MSGGITAPRGDRDFEPVEGRPREKKGPPPKPGVQIGKARMAPAAKQAGLPQSGPGQEAPISTKRPAPATDQQQRFSEDQQLSIKTLIGLAVLHPESLKVEGFAYKGGKLGGDAIVENLNKFMPQLEKEGWTDDFSLSVGQAIIKAFEDAEPFTKTGYELFLQAGNKKATEEEKMDALKKAMDTLSDQDKQVMKMLGKFIQTTAEAQKEVPIHKGRMNQEILATAFTTAFVQGDFKAVEKNFNTIARAIAFLAQNYESI